MTDRTSTTHYTATLTHEELTALKADLDLVCAHVSEDHTPELYAKLDGAADNLCSLLQDTFKVAHDHQGLFNGFCISHEPEHHKFVRMSVASADLTHVFKDLKTTKSLVQEIKLALQALREGKTSPVDLGPLKWKASK
jgi:hypothetical protein